MLVHADAGLHLRAEGLPLHAAAAHLHEDALLVHAAGLPPLAADPHHHAEDQPPHAAEVPLLADAAPPVLPGGADLLVAPDRLI